MLIVDDEENIRETLALLLKRRGYSVHTAPSSEEALRVVGSGLMPDLVITDLRLPGISGIDLLKLLRKTVSHSEVIVITAYGTVDEAVEAMKEGAYDFITKPIKPVLLMSTVEKALEHHSLRIENERLRRMLEEGSVPHMVGRSPVFHNTLQLMKQVAPSEATVLILGESGTGKELAARAIHRMSSRASGPFVAVNCAALPESIIEAELFGHEKGAFTGAEKSRTGRIRQAHGGTLFLDEIGDLSPQVQVKLLRFLQEGEIEPVGSDVPVQVDVRVIAATNRPLKELVDTGRFRADLYYRLNVISVHMPPLRERMEDVPLLATHFLEKYARKNRRDIRGITPEAMELLTTYPWPGNVRELENAMERAVVLATGDLITPRELPSEITGTTDFVPAITVPLGTPLEEIKQRLIHETLKITDGDKRAAAKILGIAVRTIYRRLSEDEDSQQHTGSPDRGE